MLPFPWLRRVFCVRESCSVFAVMLDGVPSYMFQMWFPFPLAEFLHWGRCMYLLLSFFFLLLY